MKKLIVAAALGLFALAPLSASASGFADLLGKTALSKDKKSKKKAQPKLKKGQKVVQKAKNMKFSKKTGWTGTPRVIVDKKH